MPYRVGHGNAGLTGGEIKVITPADPAVGDFVFAPYTVPAGKIVRILYVSARLTTSSAVGTRKPILTLRAEDGETLFSTSFSTQAASASKTMMGFGSGPTNLLDQNSGSARGFPAGPWPAGVLLEMNDSAGQAGDAWSEVHVFVEEWEGV